MIGWLVFAATQVVGVLLMRPIYGRIRAYMIDYGMADFPTLYAPDPVRQFNERDHLSALFLTCLAGVLWPLALVGSAIGLLLGRWIRGSSHCSHWERDHALTQATLRIQELERELGVR